MLALVSRRVTAVFAVPRRLGRGAERFRVRFAASSSDDAPSRDAPAGPGMGTIVDPVPVGTVRSSAHLGPSIKRTAQRVAPRRTADPSALPENPMERHRKRRVKKFVKRASAAAFETSRFPYSHDDFDFDGHSATAAEVERAFAPLVSSERMARLESVIDQRTFDLMPVLEGVYDIGNVLAACRSAEALGVGCLGVISDTGLAFKQSGRTSGGAVKWTHLDQWRSTPNAIDDLKQRGYRVLVTVFEGGHPLEAYDWTVPTAVILGNEREGVSEEAKAMADGGVYISMSGFTESLNVSVASALTMHHAAQDRRRRSPRGVREPLGEGERTRCARCTSPSWCPTTPGRATCGSSWSARRVFQRNALLLATRGRFRGFREENARGSKARRRRDHGRSRAPQRAGRLQNRQAAASEKVGAAHAGRPREDHERGRARGRAGPGP